MRRSEPSSPSSFRNAEPPIGNAPHAVLAAAEQVRRDAADTMQHCTTPDLTARLMCRVDARKLGVVLAWLDQHAKAGGAGMRPDRCTCEQPSWSDPFVGACEYCELQAWEAEWGLRDEDLQAALDGDAAPTREEALAAMLRALIVEQETGENHD